VVRLDAVEHHAPRLVYAGALARLAAVLETEWRGEVLSWDQFARGLRGLWAARKGRRKDGEDEGQVVLLVTKAERLKGVLGAEWTAMTRLGELVSSSLLSSEQETAQLKAGEGSADSRPACPPRSSSAPRCRGTTCAPRAATPRSPCTSTWNRCGGKVS
jgi:hypothetical protein